MFLALVVMSADRFPRRFLLARHGETEWNVEGRIQGTLLTPNLTAKGVQQASSLGTFIATEEAARIGAVWCSPAIRAKQTLERIEDPCHEGGHSLPTPRFLDGLVEINLFEWQGRLKSEIMETDGENWKRWRRDAPTYVNPEGRAPLPELFRRATKNWEVLREGELIDDDDKDTVLVVAHRQLNRFMLGSALHLDVRSTSSDARFEFKNCDVFEVTFDEATGPADSIRKLQYY